jgi:hypothetical protein
VVALLTVLAVTPVATVAMASTGAAATANLAQHQNADLAITQPHYVSDPVTTASANGTTVYEVTGERQVFAPQNFAAENVVDFGLETSAGALGYDRELGAFVFRAENQTGTFRAYWIVAEEVPAEGENATGTTIEQRRYEAIISVTGGTGLAHVPESDLTALREQAEKWSQVTSRVDGLTVNEIEAAVRLRYDALSYLTGQYTQLWVITILGGIGGLLFILQFLVPGISVVALFRRRLNVFYSTEAEEGELAERRAQQDRLDARLNFANIDLEDWHAAGDAAVLREIGDTAKDVWRRLTNEGPLNPETVYQAWLQAMGQNGYKASVVRDDDGGIRDARVLHPDEDDVDAEAFTDGGETGEMVPLTNREQVQRLIPHVVNDEAVLAFDYATAEFDDTQLDLPGADVTTPEGIRDGADGWDSHHDPKRVADLLTAFFERVDRHVYTDDDGQPVPSQEVLTELVDLSYRVRDEVGVPNADLYAQVLDRAIRNADPNKRAASRVTEVRDGVAD